MKEKPLSPKTTKTTKKTDNPHPKNKTNPK